MLEVKVIQTEDGSSSVSIPEMDETYHSSHGAITESEHVFLNAGFYHFHELYPYKKEIRILEVGFGTGLNAWLTALVIEDFTSKVKFTSIEKYPLPEEVVAQLNYATMKNDPKSKDFFADIHSVGWNKEIDISGHFSLKKVEVDLIEFKNGSNYFDIIYFDAFAPSKQPEMWVKENLQKMHDQMASGGIFVTYCAQGQFKRDMKSIGFEIEVLKGPPGKFQMIRGTK